MKRFAYKIVAVVCLICILCSSIIVPSYSCLYSDGSMTQAEMDKDVRYWRQGVVPADNSLIYSGTDRTIGRAACSHFAMSYALVKMGIFNPEDCDTPITHIKKAREFNAFSTSWGYYAYRMAPEMYPGVEFVGVDRNVDGLSEEEGLAYVKGKMSEGYYVIACVTAVDHSGKTTGTNGHMVFFDGVNMDGTVSIGDSAFYGTTWEDYYGTDEIAASWCYLELLKYDAKPSNTQPSIYKGNQLKGVSEEDVTVYKSLVKEKNLVGMPLTSNFEQYITIPVLPDSSDLTLSDQKNVQSIKDIKDSDKVTVYGVSSAISTAVGIAVVLYAVFLVLAFTFDSVNSFIDISLVKLLTFGNVKVVIDKDDLTKESKKNGYVSVVKFFTIVAVILLFGILMISGTFLRWLYKIVSSI